ncbi:unnamed protein product [Ostreobium quekettii]|uniref:Transmembrane protein n=1 Tax=Ostreobium quekettii TaxID=121088 RepID=A0A8S1IPE1_9CHLO|nr:unnamed protein product [Ostreobium quekettii]|eukprot:evm.model.scf_107.1 EVM.evm.TU.scf_107.1   scf_107:864-1766(-)
MEGRVRDDPWDSVSLAFTNPQLDDEFWRHRVVQTLCRYDLMIYLYGVLHWASLFLTLRPPPDTPVYVWVLAYPVLMFLELAAVCSSFHRLKQYVEWRTCIVAVIRVCAILVTSITLYAPPGKTPLAAMARLLSQTPVAASVIFGCGLQLPFRLHVAVQFLSCTVAMLFVPSYVKAWELQGEALAGACRSVGGTVDWALRALVWVGPAEAGEEGLRDRCSCCLVMYFLQWVVGFVAPSAFIYCVESYSRKDYIFEHGRLTRKERRTVRRAWRRAVPSAMLCAVIGAVTLWELLKATSMPAS